MTPMGRPTRTAAILTVCFVVGVVLPLANPPRYLVTVLTQMFVYAVFAMSLDLLVGYTGLASLGHAAFWGLGAYTAGLVARGGAASVLVALPSGAAVAGLGAVVIGAICVRTAGVYFLMLTLAFAQMVYAAAFKWTWLTGGSNGLSGVPKLQLPGVGSLEGTGVYELSLVVCAATLVGLWRLTRAPLGRTLVGIRENEGRMRALGYNTYRYKLAAFTVAGVLAGLAGALSVAYSGYVSPNDVFWTASGQVMVMVIIGGLGTLLGPALGAVLVLLLQNLVSSVPGIGDRWELIMGAVFVAFVLFGRGGMVGIARNLRRPPEMAGRREGRPTMGESVA
jgi:branched-chain amino acid transport system permease protein